MANPFAINIVTVAGTNLIAQATSTNQIIIVDALSSPNAATDADDLASKNASFYNGISGTIQSSSATLNIAKVVSRFGNAGLQSQPVKSVCIRGRLANQSDSQAVIMAAMSDSDSSIYLPSDESPMQITRFIFNFAVNADDTVETVFADGATMADLERFVSMYKAGDPTDGDNQTIKGVKTFEDNVIGDYIEANSILATARLECSAECYFGSDVYITGGISATGDIETSTRVVPSSNNSGSVGYIGKRFENGYFQYLHVVDVETESITFLYGDDSFVFKTENGNISCGTGVYPSTNGSFDLGTASKQWGNVYALSIQLAGSSDVKLYEDDGDIFAKCNSLYIGSPGSYGNIYALNLNASEVRFASQNDVRLYEDNGKIIAKCNSFYVGTFGNFVDVYADTFKGKFSGLVVSLGEQSPVVGSLAEIEIANGTDTTQVTLLRGSSVFDGDVISGPNKTVSVTLDGVSVSTNKWKILNKCTFTNVASKVLAVRVE